MPPAGAARLEDVAPGFEQAFHRFFFERLMPQNSLVGRRNPRRHSLNRPKQALNLKKGR